MVQSGLTLFKSQGSYVTLVRCFFHCSCLSKLQYLSGSLDNFSPLLSVNAGTKVIFCLS